MKKRKKGAYFSRPPCHSGPVEVIENLFCGSEMEALVMVESVRVDTLIPLNRLEAEIWDLGFRGEVLYYPIRDYGILPDDVLDGLVSNILDRLGSGKKVGLFCMGGHGRTGYVASVVLGRLGYEDPIQFLRSNYCREAVESGAQVQHIAEVLGKPELVQEHGFQSGLGSLDEFYDFLPAHYARYGFNADYSSPVSATKETCGDCARRIAGTCQRYKVFVDEYDLACSDFARRI